MATKSEVPAAGALLRGGTRTVRRVRGMTEPGAISPTRVWPPQL